jgi:dolichol-phosphate mannosyltransferase
MYGWNKGGAVSDAAPPRVLVSTATYNEADNLPVLVRAIHGVLPDAEILVVDDNSPDGTGRLADELAAADPRLHVLHRKGKLGLGTAILTGMRYAIDHDYDFFVNVDADLSHDPRYLPALLAGMRNHDLMIGSRYVPGGGTKNWPVQRRLISKSVNMLARLMMRLPARDASGGYRCYRVASLKKVDLSHMLSFGYSFQQEVLYRCWKAKCRIGETPIVFEDRREGASKANVKEMIRSLGVLFTLGLGATFGVDVRGK